MDTYTLDIKADGDYTYVRVPELDYATQARTPDEIERMGRDLIATLLEIEPDAFKIIINDPQRIIPDAGLNPIMSIDGHGNNPRDYNDFTADDWFHITGRGWVATIDGKYTRDLIEKGLWTPEQLVNRPQRIDGHAYLVIGVETFRLLVTEDHPYTMSFGLLVKGPRITHNPEQEHA